MVGFNKTLKKELLSTIRKNIKRYISIVLITFLGACFFVGMKSSSPVLKKNMSEYFVKHNYMDIQVSSNIGITNEEIDIIKQIPGVENVEGGFTENVSLILYDKDIKKDNNYNIILHSFNKDTSINTLNITDGRMAKDASECVADTSIRTIGYDIGDTIHIPSDHLKNEDFTIVGFARSPIYISYSKATSVLLGDSIDYFIYLHESNFKVENGDYSNAFVTINNKLQPFTEEYDNEIFNISNKIEKVINPFFQERKDKFIAEKRQLYQDAEEKFNNESTSLKQELENAKNEIEEAKVQISEAEGSLLSDNEIDIYLANAKNSLDLAKLQMDSQFKLIDNTKRVLKVVETQALDVWDLIESDYLHKEVEYAKKILKKAEEELEAKKKEYKELDNKCDILKGEKINDTCENAKKRLLDIIATNEKLIAKTKQEIQEIQKLIDMFSEPAKDFSKDKIKEIKDTIERIKNGYEDAHKAYQNGLKEYNYAKEHMKDEMHEARALIEEKKQELADAEVRYDEYAELLDNELQNNYQDLLDAKKILGNLDLIKFVVDDRNDNYGYSTYNDDITRIAGLSTVFPIFFYLVASLVTVSSITRMVTEERKKTGILKSLGYKDSIVIRKYLYYIASAVIIGSVLGSVLGTFLFPQIFSIVYSLVYYLPDLTYKFYFGYIAIGILLSLFSCVFVGYLSIRKVLKESPYQLMRVKNDKFSGPLFIERFPDLWDKFSLQAKLIMKNIIKKPIRSIMTIIGVAGCTSLIIASFGIRDNISNVIRAQYGSMFDVNSEFFFKNELTEEEKQEYTQEVLNLQDVKYASLTNLSSVDVIIPNKVSTLGVYKVVTDDYKNLKKMIKLNDVETNENFNLDDDGVIITEKLAKMLKIKVGETFKFVDENDKSYEVKVSGIAKNYVFHYIYMTKEYNKKLTNHDVDGNTLFIKYQADTDSESADDSLKALGYFYGNMSMADAEKAYDEIMDKFNIVIAVIIVCSGLLAFVVLYNLAKINFSEKVREIATLKVLGYKTKEVYKYVNSESLILSLIGIISGCFVGRFLADAVLNMCELDSMMYMRGISLNVYLISIVITTVFILLINIVVRKDLRSVKMVESLKMVE